MVNQVMEILAPIPQTLYGTKSQHPLRFISVHLNYIVHIFFPITSSKVPGYEEEVISNLFYRTWPEGP